MDPSNVGNTLSLILDLEVAVAAATRQTPRQYVAESSAPQPPHAAQVLHRSIAPTRALTHIQILTPSSMATVVATGFSTLPVQLWTTILRKGKTVSVAAAPTSKRGNLVERSIVTEHQGRVRGSSKIECPILFPHKTGAPPKYRRESLDITHRLNMALSAATVPTHISITQLNYNEKGNLSGLMAPATTTSMLLPQHRELVLKAVRQLEQDVTDVTEDQR